jgi:hypothetical protein
MGPWEFRCCNPMVAEIGRRFASHLLGTGRRQQGLMQRVVLRQHGGQAAAAGGPGNVDG